MQQNRAVRAQAEGGEGEVLALLAAADFFSDDTLRAKCDAALAAAAAEALRVGGWVGGRTFCLAPLLGPCWPQRPSQSFA